MTLPLKTVLQAGYDPKKIKDVNLSGYINNPKYTNDNQQVYHNRRLTHTVVNISGTHNAKDIFYNDPMVAVGLGEQLDRTKQARNVLEKARKDYPNSKITITSHSLGSNVGNIIKQPTDKHISYNGAYTPNQKHRSGTTNYRTKNDIVSTFAPKSKTIGSSPYQFKTPSHTVNLGLTALASHKTNNIPANIYI